MYTTVRHNQDDASDVVEQIRQHGARLQGLMSGIDGFVDRRARPGRRSPEPTDDHAGRGRPPRKVAIDVAGETVVLPPRIS
ncbi:hypothetical protein [Actinomycetospora sp. NBC_00405]|uniref:hypothetical protein n=1 Tax=Actinomycetospora sp. NBC_00405 TaxID=2975952 RepID=UPI002E1AE350